MKRSRGRPRSARSENVVIPSFVDDYAYLESVGIVTKKERRNKTPKYVFRREATTEDKVYRWQSTKNGTKYHLSKVLDHKMEYDVERCLADHEQDTLWYGSIDFGDKTTAAERGTESNDDDEVKVRENGGGKGGDMEVDGDGDGGGGTAKEGVTPQICFGRLRFECQWEDWPDTTWEPWHCIKHTAPFQQYCTEKGWSPQREWLPTAQETPPDRFKEIVANMALYGPPNTRKALKQLLFKSLDSW